MRDKPISSKRSPESAVTEIGVSCNDSDFFRAVTTTSSKLALTPVGKVAIATRHTVPAILCLNVNESVCLSDRLLSGAKKWGNCCSKLAIT